VEKRVALAQVGTRGIVNFYPQPAFFLHSEIRRSFTNDFRGNSAGGSLNPILLDLRPGVKAPRRNARHVESPRRLPGHCSDGRQNAPYRQIAGCLPPAIIALGSHKNLFE